MANVNGGLVANKKAETKELTPQKQMAGMLKQMLPEIKKAVGNTKCHAHIQCDSIIMDHAQVASIPEIDARHLDAAIIHEAAIGRINDEQLVKLRTLGMTEEEAEGVIIENFLN